MATNAAPIRITTERLILRDFVPEDAAAMFRVTSDPEVARYTGDEVPQSVRDTERILRAHPIADYAKYGFGRWACVLRSTGAVIGFCGLKYLPDLDEVDVGYRLARDQWGQGLATEGALAVVQHGFEVLKLTRVIGLVMPANVASIRVLEKVGLRPVGPIEDQGIPVLKYELER